MRALDGDTSWYSCEYLLLLIRKFKQLCSISINNHDCNFAAGPLDEFPSLFLHPGPAAPGCCLLLDGIAAKVSKTFDDE